MTVIKLGGCNGSGKTSVARGILDIGDKAWNREKVVLQSGKTGVVYSNVLEGRRFEVLGKYDTACGGMDTISDKDDRLTLVKYRAENNREGIVFFEGLITGKTFGALGALSVEHKAAGIPWLYAFMDTPFETCVDRVLTRRAAAGNFAEFDPERTMRSTFKSCVRLAEKLQNGELPEFPVMMLPHKRGPKTLASLLLEKAFGINRARR